MNNTGNVIRGIAKCDAINSNRIQSCIYTLRGLQIMIDSDLAELYGVQIKRLNEQVKRNAERFPGEFCFQLNEEDIDSLRSQIATSREGDALRSQTVTLETKKSLRSQIATSKWGGR